MPPSSGTSCGSSCDVPGEDSSRCASISTRCDCRCATNCFAFSVSASQSTVRRKSSSAFIFASSSVVCNGCHAGELGAHKHHDSAGAPSSTTEANCGEGTCSHSTTTPSAALRHGCSKSQLLCRSNLAVCLATSSSATRPANERSGTCCTESNLRAFENNSQRCTEATLSPASSKTSQLSVFSMLTIVLRRLRTSSTSRHVAAVTWGESTQQSKPRNLKGTNLNDISSHLHTLTTHCIAQTADP